MPFNALKDSDFIGRQDELAILMQRTLLAESGMARSLVLSGPRGIGKTELTKQLFNHLFWRQDRVAPFYYSVNPASLSIAAFAKHYLAQFIRQRIAFENKDQGLLHQDTNSSESLAALVNTSDAAWAQEVLDRFEEGADDPLNALRVALEAPRLSARSSGRPVAVLIDGFHLLQDLHVNEAVDARLISLFEDAMSDGRTPHMVTGNAAALQEMPVVYGLERMQLSPLGTEDAATRVGSLLQSFAASGSAPPLLLRRLGGNPLYLESVARTAGKQAKLEDGDFWNAYIHEIMEGTLALSWSSMIKASFPDLAARRVALAILHKVVHTAEPLSCQRIAKTFTLTDDRAEMAAHALYAAGLIRGEFGVFRALDDAVARDVIDCLYMKEILAKSPRDITQEFLEKLLPGRPDAIRFEMVLPMAKESELVAAQCLEQIGKNLNLDPDAIGQLQIAVIEACINAFEHSKAVNNKLTLIVSVEDDRLEVAVESTGKEFIVQETGEPFGSRSGGKPAGRGWGIKLMKRFADDVRFEKTSRGIKVVIVKKLAKAAQTRGEDTTDHE